VINIAHLEPYSSENANVSDRPTIEGRRKGFEELPEYKVDEIIGE
jgi:hypothetical protein